ncbi:MAG: DUF3093 domain-containing protein [Actinomycetes bacterium]
MFLEKVYPPPISWFLTLIFGFAMGLVFGAPFGVTAGMIGGLLAAGLVSFSLWRSIFEISIDGEMLIAEGNEIPRAQITLCTPLDREATRSTLGPKADPAALIIMRGWVHTAVKLDIADPEKKRPYIFISTRQSDTIADLLNKKG